MGASPQNRFWFGFDELAKGFSCVRVSLHQALIGSVIDDFPTFGPNSIGRNLFLEPGFEIPSTPDIRTKKGFKSDWLLKAAVNHAFQFNKTVGTVRNFKKLRGLFVIIIA
jgi:hypothetical protein